MQNRRKQNRFFGIDETLKKIPLFRAGADSAKQKLPFLARHIAMAGRARDANAPTNLRLGRPRGVNA